MRTPSSETPLGGARSTSRRVCSTPPGPAARPPSAAWSSTSYTSSARTTGSSCSRPRSGALRAPRRRPSRRRLRRRDDRRARGLPRRHGPAPAAPRLSRVVTQEAPDRSPGRSPVRCVALLPDRLDPPRLGLRARDGAGAHEPRDEPVRAGVAQLREPHRDLAVVTSRQARRLLVPGDAEDDLAGHVRDEPAGDLHLHLGATADGDLAVVHDRVGGGVDLALPGQREGPEVADPTGSHRSATHHDRSTVAVPVTAERVAVLLPTDGREDDPVS